MLVGTMKDTIPDHNIKCLHSERAKFIRFAVPKIQDLRNHNPERLQCQMLKPPNSPNHNSL